MENRDLTPQKDPKGGSPKTPYPGTPVPRRPTPKPIPVSEFDEYDQNNPQGTLVPHIQMRDILAWMFRGLFVLAFFWMKATFVTNEKYDSDKGKTLSELVNISNTLVRIDEKLSKGVEVDIDHEKRIRELEHDGKERAKR